MKILVAPNALKGSLTALEAALVMNDALPHQAQVRLCPIADGGNSTLECVVNATRGEYRTSEVTGPLPGRKVRARWGVLGNSQTAVVEMAEASGLHLLTPGEYDVAHATTRGVGELITIILGQGFRKIIVGLGGSATHDCGTGCARALDVKFLDAGGEELCDGGTVLAGLHAIDASQIHPLLSTAEIIVLTDVTNPLTGAMGAAHTFAAQKGADAETIERLEAASVVYENRIRCTPFSIDTKAPGMGAAGGLASGLAAFCGARLTSGVDFVLDTISADALLSDCDIVLTAEGALDAQTEQGKGIAGIAARAHRHRKPVVAFVGRADGNREELCCRIGLKDLVVISPPSLSLKEAMDQSPRWLASAVTEYFSHIMEGEHR